MKIPLTLVALVVVCLLLVDYSDCKPDKKGKNNNKNDNKGKGGNGNKGNKGNRGKGNNGRHNGHKKPYVPVVPAPPVSNGMTPCMIRHKSGAITIPSRCPVNTMCNVGPINDGEGAQVFRCNFTAYNPCWTMYSNGTTFTAPCPPLGMCSDGPYGSVLEDGTFVLVKQCSNSPPTPCSVEWSDGSGGYNQIEPVTCNSSCNIGPLFYKTRNQLQATAYFCNGTKGVPCSTDFLNGTVYTTGCPEGSMCIFGPFNTTCPRTGVDVQTTYCNSTLSDAEFDDGEDSGAGGNSGPEPTEWVEYTPATQPRPASCASVRCSDAFSMMLSSGTTYQAAICTCDDGSGLPSPAPPCSATVNGIAVTLTSLSSVCPVNSACTIGPISVPLPDKTEMQIMRCVEPSGFRKKRDVRMNFWDSLPQIVIP